MPSAMTDRSASAGGTTAEVTEEETEATEVTRPDAESGPEAEPEGREASAEEGTGGEAAGDGPRPARRRRKAPPREVSNEVLATEVAALLFASPDPLSPGRLAELLGRPEPARVRAAIEELARRLEAAGLPVRPRLIAGGWQLLTVPEADEIVARLARERRTERLSAAALETLAVVAYRQPVTKAEIEAIRGVQAGPILRSLVDRGLIHVTGRAEVPGHPLQYGTTREFLVRFGLSSLEDLPRDGELLE